MESFLPFATQLRSLCQHGLLRDLYTAMRSREAIGQEEQPNY